MNTFGIDYQQTLSILHLREGLGLSSVERSVGDGQRAVFPNAVMEATVTKGDGMSCMLWASAALETAASGALWQGNVDTLGAWRERPGAPMFWQGMRDRLVRYLGSYEPTSRNGYRIVVALPENSDETRQDLRQMTDSARLELSPSDFISSADALLCRWIARRGIIDQDQDIIVAVVAVGDTATEIAAFGARAYAGQIARPYARSAHSTLLPYGHAGWSAELRRCPESASAGTTIGAVRTGSARYLPGIRLSLRSAGPRDRLIWVGPGRSYLNPPLELEREECSQWASVQSFAQHLIAAIAEVTKNLSGLVVPDLIALGGVGAAWPFAANAVKQVSRVWQSGIPQEDIACGAAWWPVIAEGIALDTSIPFHSTQRTSRQKKKLLLSPSEPIEVLTDSLELTTGDEVCDGVEEIALTHAKDLMSSWPSSLDDPATSESNMDTVTRQLLESSGTVVELEVTKWLHAAPPASPDTAMEPEVDNLLRAGPEDALE